MKGPPVLTPQTTRQSQPASPWLSKHLRTKRQLLTSDPGLLFILPQRHQPPLHYHLHCTTSRFLLHASQDASRVILLYLDLPWAFFRIAALINIPCFFFFFLLPSLRNSCPALRESPVSPSYSPAIPRFLCESVHDSGNPCWLRPRGLLLLLPHLYSSASPTSSSSHVYLSHLTHLGPHSHAP